MAAIIVHVVLFLVCLLKQPQFVLLGETKGNEILELNAHSFDQLLQTNSHVVILFYEGECNNCFNIVSELVKVYVPIVTDLKVGKSKDRSLSQRFGLTEFPCILYHRKGSPILYDGEITSDELSIWLEASQEVSTQTLDSDTFEHLTQAATGATTGDWFVCFYRPNCDNLLSIVDTVAFRMKQRMNVAKVDLTKSPSLGERFKINSCLTGILFRHAKMYRFPQEKFTIKTLTSFLESWYKNVPMERVVPEPSPFDVLVEKIVEQLKIYLQGPQRVPILIGLSCTGILTIVLLWCCCCSKKGPSPRLKTD